MLVTFLLSWLLAAEPAQPCSPAGAAVAVKAAPTHQCTSAASGDCDVARTEAASPAILSFEASWCAPCQQMRSVLARLKQSGVRVRHVDVDGERELARKYRVTSIPAFVRIANGREAARATGARSYNELMRLAGQAEMEPRTMKATAALAPGAIRAEMLVRATYELEPERAKALPALLETFGIDEVRQDGGHANKYAVTITTAPEAQRVIGQFLSVLGGSTSKTTAAATHHDSPKGQAIGDFEECSGREECRKIAARYLGSQAWTSDDDCRVLRIDRRMIFFKDWEALGDGTAFRFRPFAMITWQKGGREQDPVRFASDSAVLRFQSPYRLENPQHGELIGGSLEGNVRIYGSKGTVEARAHDFHVVRPSNQSCPPRPITEDQLQGRSETGPDCDGACGQDCPEKFEGECTRACKDDVVYETTQPPLMYGIGVNSEAGVVGRIVFDGPVLQRFTRYGNSASAVGGGAAGCERGCGDDCTNECNRECTTSCEDGVARGVAVPAEPGVPLVPPVWMSTAAVSPKVMFGKGIDADSGVCSSVVLDELTPALMRLTRYRVFEGAGPLYTIVLTADRGLIADVREFVETKTREQGEQNRPRLLFRFGNADRP